MTAVADYFVPSRHAFINALIFTGSTLGSAFAPPLVAHLMNLLGWRATFYVTALLPVLVGVLWLRAARPGQSGQTLSKAQLPKGALWWKALMHRNVLALCLSYFLYCYAISIFVYWLFKYLVDVRHLSIVNSGWATSLPWITASIVVPLLGYVSARFSRRVGALTARRSIAVACLIIAALLMSIGVYARTIGPAISAIAISVALLFSTESSYWSTAIDIAPEDAGASSGLMNLAGNLGGVLSTLLVPVLVTAFDWSRALLSGSVFALLAAGCWFLIRTQASIKGGHIAQAEDGKVQVNEGV
jgi:ACS family glucarate transporter-like MFS transporter